MHDVVYSFKYKSGRTTNPTSSPISSNDDVTTNVPTNSPTFNCRIGGLRSFMNTFRPKKRMFDDDDWVLSLTISKKKPLDAPFEIVFGSSIAMTGDGLKLFVGSMGYPAPDNGFGVVFVFSLTDGSEIQRINAKYPELLGYAVAVSNNGNHLAISSYSTLSFSVYNQGIDGDYNQVGTRIYVAQADRISFSLDGNRIVIGSYLNDEVGVDAGKTYVYSVNNDETELVGTFDGRSEESWFGLSVALSEDGSTVAIGGPIGGPSGDGYVQVFDYDSV